MVFWRWLWRRCSRVEILEVEDVDDVILESLADGVPVHMSSINKIRMNRFRTEHMSEKVVESVLSGSRAGLEVVDVIRFGEKSKNALIKHYPTLKVLMMKSYGAFTDEDLVQVLSSCPNLHTLVAIDGSESTTTCRAATFADLDPDTGLPKTWLCKNTLKVLKVDITGIARPDLNRDQIIEDEYPGQEQQIQDRVYERLASLVNLERLWLGRRRSNYGQQDHNRHCLDLSLANGLHKLASLRELQELNVSSLKTCIGALEACWIGGHWPKLRAVYGLDGDGDGKEAVAWLREHRPKIELSCWM
ncbi:hypothetical protein B0O80DRAFT_466734 [Mortierella sp. GBAus27b]|nr:hypothetical protein B0O80DRAFT_466734 [Mortierella sp. GBAus27b]